MSDATRSPSRSDAPPSGAVALVAPASPARLFAGLRHWPARRWIVAGSVLLPMVLLYASMGMPPTVWALPVTLVQAALAALIIASYLPAPGTGRWLEVGCTPCAAVAGMSVLGTLVMRQTDPWDLGIGLVAVLLLGYGVVKRLQDAGPACATR